MVIELLNFSQRARAAVQRAILEHSGMNTPAPPEIVTGSALGMSNGSRQIIKVHDTDDTRLKRTMTILCELELSKISGAPWTAILQRAKYIVSEANEVVPQANGEPSVPA